MGNDYPRVPGHEVVGVIEKLGAGLGTQPSKSVITILNRSTLTEKSDWKVGLRVGAGWHGGHCGFCMPCRRGDFILCKNELITGITHDGGYGTFKNLSDEIRTDPSTLLTTS